MKPCPSMGGGRGGDEEEEDEDEEDEVGADRLGAGPTSAQSAQPEYELRTVMTTGMSAPPIEAVMWSPRPPERMPAILGRRAA